MEFFFIGQNRSSNQRSGMILEIQIQISACAPAHGHQNYHLKEIPGGLNINIFVKIGFGKIGQFWIWTSKIIPDLWLLDLF